MNIRKHIECLTQMLLLCNSNSFLLFLANAAYGQNPCNANYICMCECLCGLDVIWILDC